MIISCTTRTSRPRVFRRTETATRRKRVVSERARRDRDSVIPRSGAIGGSESFECVVIENRAASVDGAKRTLVVAIEDAQNVRGKELRRTTERTFVDSGKKWTERYETPGQFVKARGDGWESGALAIARSPYHVRYDSARLDSAKVEFLVDERTDAAALTGAKPGDVFYVSEPLGCGFSNVLFADRSLKNAMQHECPCIIIACGTRGLAHARSLLDWQPVMAYADAHPVSLFYLCESQEGAALLSLHDEWREEGFKVVPCYGALEDQLFLMEQCFITGAVAAGGKPTVLGPSAASCSVLLAGAEGETAGRILTLLTSRGIARENILTPN
ncbi:unnamed product [Ostreococcus tauri]|uniref:Unnamed product n=1 Tax=Ostreococcus tauri TaxID=70448 RepID=A0A098E5S4_OSTTA|nr:unnamed product [Ostreococcus tauri]CEG01848.1 unnamed product [Ostreococcus tauri]|eukprot:XP_022841203.1 unnamed product [Ostreococcus tauri]